MIIDTFFDLYKNHPDHALRALRMCKQVLDYAIAKEMRDGPNPAEWRGHLEHIFPERPKADNKHYPSLPFKDVPELMRRLSLREMKGTSPLALRFQILTASRPGETLGMFFRTDHVRPLSARSWGGGVCGSCASVVLVVSVGENGFPFPVVVLVVQS